MLSVTIFIVIFVTNADIVPLDQELPTQHKQDQSDWEVEPLKGSNGYSVPVVLLKKKSRDTWVAQSVKRLTSAQVVISWFVSSSPMSGSVLTAQSLGAASDPVSPSLSLPLPNSCSVSVSKINKHKKILNIKKF